MDNCIAPKELRLKVGAQVMLLKNLAPERRLVNGARGIVVGFKPARRIGFDQLLVDYPAEGGDLAMPYLPEVKFLTSDDGRTGPTVLIDPDEWSLESGRDKVAWRKQLPLKLAWAISIHKSQGMTLEAAELDLASCFEPGHAYVALSRVVSLAATRLLSFDPSRVYAHPKVVAYYERLDGGGGAPRAAAAHAPGGGGGGGGGGGLSAEQRARIEASKAAALARRQQALGQQSRGLAP